MKQRDKRVKRRIAWGKSRMFPGNKRRKEWKQAVIKTDFQVTHFLIMGTLNSWKQGRKKYFGHTCKPNKDL